MYGTIFRLQPKPGHEAEIVSLMEEWNRNRGPQLDGARAAYLLQSERRPGEFVGVAVFDDERTYQENAGAPEQEQWYRRLRDALEADPIWEDGAFVAASHFSSNGG